MKPSELSARLRRIAAKIDNSTNPDKNLVMQELQHVVASISHTSQVRMSMEIQIDEKSGAYKFKTKEISQDDDKIVLQVIGKTEDGKPFKGVMTAFLSDGEFDGWEWNSQMGSLPSNPESVQPILDVFADEYGL